MISRRNIRVKVVQAIYAVESESGNMSDEKAINLLKKYLDETSDLFLFLVYLITEVARYAETHAKNKASKHLPSLEDLSINTKIAGNTLLWSIFELPGFKSGIKDRGLNSQLDEDIVKRTYLKLIESEEYKTYIAAESRDKKSEKNLLSFIFTDLIIADEFMTDYIEEHYVQWDDDSEMIYQMMMNFLSKPNSFNFQLLVGPEKREYAINLLKTALTKKEHTMDIITPKLKNWDPERIAVLDMIIIRLGVCELLYFETIPAKVTLNEYIDIAKSYSTNQSGHFVNGILDSIHKEMISEGTLNKVDFKK